MVEVAKGAGFCFGVKRAVEKVENLLDRGFKVCTLGEIIHNRPFCDTLKQRGVRVVEKVGGRFINSDEYLIFRSHGVEPQVYDDCFKNKINFVDATCPFVKRIHKIVKLKSNQGRTILIAGDRNHPEVCAIEKYCSGEVFIFSDFNFLWPYLKKRCLAKLTLVAQTTFNSVLWADGIKKLKKLGLSNLEIFNTICYATVNRQNEAVELAKRVDFMIVVGGKNSSNSKKLFDLCASFCKTLFVEEISELETYLRFNRLSQYVGICAGASTPLTVIKKVFDLVNLNLS